MKMYANGVEIGSSNYVGTGTLINTGSTMKLGRDNNASYGKFQGELDEVRIYDKALTAAENDPFLFGQQSNFTPNVGTGIYFANPDFFLGVSVPYILENRVYDELDLGNSDLPAVDKSFLNSRESRYYYATTGGVIHLTNLIKLNPSVLLRIQEEQKIGWDLNINVIFDEIAYVGTNIRRGGDLTFLGQLILNENFRVGYAYDAITNNLNDYSAGSHEILVNYRIKLRNYKRDPGCPVYF